MFIKKSFLRRVYKKRKSWSRKGNFGRLLIIGGSSTYVGAPLFAGVAAMRAGCDLVHVAAPTRAANIIARTPDLITHLMRGDHLAKKHLSHLKNISKRVNAITIGNGLGDHKDTITAVIAFLKKNKLPTVIDGDAFQAVARDKRLLKGRLLTPHAGEFFLLTKRSVGNELDRRKRAVKQFAKKYNCTIILKGHIDVISDGKNVALNKTGNVYMTKGGTGDSLAGISGTLLARGASAFDAAAAAAYINGAAGDVVARQKGESTITSDIIDKIPDVIK